MTVATIVCLLSAGFAALPAAEAQDLSAPELEILTFEMQQDGSPVTFVEHGDAAYWYLEVRANGFSAQEWEAPVFVREVTTSGVLNRCYRISFDNTQNDVATLGPEEFGIPDEHKDQFHKLEVYVNHNTSEMMERDTVNADDCEDPQTFGTGAFETQPTAQAAYHYVIDRKFDLEVTQVDMCKGASKAGDCKLTDGEDQVWNRTLYPGDEEDQTRDAHFRITIENTGNWSAPWDPNSEGCDVENGTGCAEFEYPVKVRVYELQSGDENLVANLDFTTSGEHVIGGAETQTYGMFYTEPWNIFGLAGKYKVVVEADPDDLIDEIHEDNTYTRASPYVIEYADLVPKIDTSNLWHPGNEDNESHDYGTDGLVRIPVRFSFENIGNLDARDDRNSVYLWHLLVDGEVKHSGEVGINVPANGEKDGFQVNLEGNETQLPPGVHTLTLRVDWPDYADCENDDYAQCPDEGKIWERYNTENNEHTVQIVVHDEAPPRIEDAGAICDIDDRYADVCQYGDDAQDADLAVRIGHWVRLNATVEDSDVELDVKLNVTHPTAGSFEVNMTPEEAGSTNYVYNFTDGIRFNGTAVPGIATTRVIATDTAGNVVTTDPFVVNTTLWGIQTMPELEIYDAWNSNVDNHTYRYIQYQSHTSIDIRLNVSAAWTGIPEPDESTKWIRLYEPDGDVTTTHPGADNCEEDAPSDGGVGLFPDGDDDTCDGVQYYSLSLSTGEAGRHYMQVLINDTAGMTRWLNVSFLVYDGPAAVNVISLPEEREAGESFTVWANITDDHSVERAWANFTRTDGAYNVSIPLAWQPNDWGDHNMSGVWEAEVTTGARGNITWGGAYDVKIAVLDAEGRWTEREADERFTVLDSEPPKIVDSGVTPARQELDFNVSAWIRVTDETHTRVYLTIQQGFDVIVDDVLLTDTDGDNNYTYTTQFDEAGVYAARFKVLDSTGTEPVSGERRHNFQIVENLPPRFDVKQPGIYDDATGVYLASGRPVIQVLVYDSDGVLNDSIRFSHQGIERSDIDLVPSQDPPGWLVTYTPPLSADYQHGRTYNVSLEATDNSSKTLASEPYEFSFMVDRSPPRTSLTGISPSYAAQDGHVLNVSLDSLFTLEAEDTDNVPTGVKQIMYKISGAQAGGDVVYTEPFRIRDAPDNVYRGPTTYQITYWAEDDVGNEEPHLGDANTITVFVDDAGPDLDPFTATPRPCDGTSDCVVRAAFTDTRTGVERAVVWYRVNNGAYQALEMTVDDEGIWTAEVPGGKKGDTISYYLQAWDYVENTNTFGTPEEPRVVFEVGNRQPSIHLTSPEEDATLSDAVPIEWTSVDPDEDDLTFKVSYRLAGNTNWLELARLQGDAGTYTWDTTTVRDGTYEIQVSVTDGTFVNYTEVQVHVLNAAGTAIEDAQTSETETRPGRPVTVTAKVTKANADVQAVVYRNGKWIENVTLYDDGLEEHGDEAADDGVYSAIVTYDEDGAYRVDVYARYSEGGEMKEALVSEAAAFSVDYTSPDIFKLYSGLWAAVAALAVAAVGVGAYALNRKWRKK